jgi:HEAT repeat protein
MKTRKRILIFALPALLIFFGWLMMRPREPRFEGKPLSVWLEGYNLPMAQYQESWLRADEVVRQTGTNAIPTLLAMLRLSDSSPLKRALLDLAARQHFIKIQHVHAWAQNWRAALAFKALGSTGRDAVPELMRLYEYPPSAPSKRYTAMALGNIGPAAQAAVPLLLRGLDSSSDEEVKASVIPALGQIHAEPGQVVPALMKCLSGNSTEVEAGAAKALGNFGADAEPAIPALIEILESPRADLRACATNALKQIDAGAAAKAGIK